MIQYTDHQVKLFKGAAASILLVLINHREPVNAEYLERCTGFSDKSILAALQQMLELGLLTRNGRYAWQLASHTEQPALPVQEELPAEVETKQDEPEETGGTRRISESENFRVALVDSSGSRLTNQETRKYLPQEDSRRGESEKFRVDPDPGVLEACDECGIEEPARTKLARLVKVSAELVRQHCGEAPTIGAAIWRLEHGWRGRRSAKDQEKNERNKYVGGEFADFITH